MNRGNEIVGELYVFKKLSDSEFADGIHTAYLCAFRIIKELRGQGYGTKLIANVDDNQIPNACEKFWLLKKQL
ncbi:MAG: GNAT family N-acetyltransferase [Clostridium sp.]|uniref:GNAT family N-acetyltransferase n=1 Tax=Clostridium sp. TaxID=1506 RepID=UPI00302F387E